MKRSWFVVLPVCLSAVLSLAGWRPFAQSGAWQPPAKSADAVRTLVVTGGHDHDADFYSVFADDRIRAVVDPHPAAFRGDIRRRADVLVLYDHVPDSVEEPRRKNLRDFAESGKGIVILHHAICSHVKWPWWYEEVAGGRWLFEPANGMPVTTYKHDEEIDVKIAFDHPITRGLKDFRIHDETYKGLWISPKVKPLLTTDHPLSDKTIAWVSPYEKSRVVYIQLGHDRQANLNPNYQTLVRQAILWAAGRL
jgi:type 1 glutamine amidotransferase